jgi:uncharacterized protein
MHEHATTNDHQSSPLRRLAHRRPIAMFLVIVLGLSLPVDAALLASGQDISPGILLSVILLLGVATLVTALSEGRAGVRRLFAGVIRWRMGLARFFILVTAMPLLTLLVGALTGTLQTRLRWRSTPTMPRVKRPGALSGAVANARWRNDRPAHRHDVRRPNSH